MRVLFIHQNFPGQYLHIASYLAARGCEVTALGEAGLISQRGTLPGVQTLGYPTPAANGAGTHHYLQSTEAAVRRGQSAARALLEMRGKGYVPDVVCAHPGWGEALFLRDIFPGTPLLMFSEYYFRAQQADQNFDPEFPYSMDWNFSVRIRNSPQLLSLLTADACVCPTAWQASRYPDFIQQKIHLIHDGIDCAYMSPAPGDSLSIQPLEEAGESRVIADAGQGGSATSTDAGPPHTIPDIVLTKAPITLTAKDKVITFISRNLEPYRGYHIFMRALPEIQRRHPDAQVLLVGADNVSYSPAPPQGSTYKEMFLKEVRDRLDMSKVHFLGRISYQALRSMFRISSVHVYLTYPFVLSWSMLEAMACGSLVLASRTAPVEEVLEDGVNGLMTDFFDISALAGKVDEALASPDSFKGLREEARKTVLERFELNKCLVRQADLINKLAAYGHQAP